MAEAMIKVKAIMSITKQPTIRQFAYRLYKNVRDHANKRMNHKTYFAAWELVWSRAGYQVSDQLCDAVRENCLSQDVHEK